jgi:U3 small nucleolar RNA-associated protein 23
MFVAQFLIFMKIKRQRNSKRHMAMYAQSFKFRKPYQVILDGTYLHVARMCDMKLELLERVLVGECRMMTTYCVYAELKKMGPDYRPTAAMAKRLEKRRCTHSPAVPAIECLKEIMGTKNSHNYCIATQDAGLREHLRAIPGTPLVYINKSVMILEPPSQATLERVQEVLHLNVGYCEKGEFRTAGKCTSDQEDEEEKRAKSFVCQEAI